jgi:hypothetical protein
MPILLSQTHHCLYRCRESSFITWGRSLIAEKIPKHFSRTRDVSDDGGQPAGTGLKQCQRKSLPSGTENEAVRSTHPGQDFGLKARKMHTVSQSEILDKCVQLIFELTIA